MWYCGGFRIGHEKERKVLHFMVRVFVVHTMHTVCGTVPAVYDLGLTNYKQYTLNMLTKGIKAFQLGRTSTSDQWTGPRET